MIFPRLHPRIASLLALAALSVAGATAAESGGSVAGWHVLKPAEFAPFIAKFNTMEPEGVVNAVPNAQAWSWLKANVPAFECSDPSTEEIYWFRWWSLRKHLERDPKTGLWVFTEFITKPRPISSALGHHLMETRWLRNPEFSSQYIRYWLQGNDGRPQTFLHKYSQWLDYALWQRWLVVQDTPELTGLVDDLVADYNRWVAEQGRPDGLFWQYDVRDAMEESISGGRHVKNVRPTINSYMYGNAVAIARIARLAGREDLAREFEARAASLRTLVEKTLWNPQLKFFCAVNEKLQPIPVREEIGFIPWYFELPEPGKGYEVAWKQFTDDRGFRAPFGITTAERRSPQFRSHGVGHCEWDGAVWPFATSQTLTALQNVLRDYPGAPVTDRDYFDAFETYVHSQHKVGKPYIGEYLDEKTGAWLKGDNPRSRYYNHSTFADLVITGIVGLRPRADRELDVEPLLPPGTWSWFGLDGVRYHGHDLTILWDRDGTRYGRGAGLTILVDGAVAAHRATLGPLTAMLP